MDRRQKRRLIRSAKAAVVCVAALYLVRGVSALDKEQVRNSVPVQEESMTANTMPEIGESLVPEIENHEIRPDTKDFEWDAEQIAGFKEYQIPEKYVREGGCFPVEIQQFTYVICGDYDVDYKLILAMIEVESAYCNSAESVCGAVGYMQVIEKWHKDRMERLNVEDLSNPYSNIMVGVDYMAELLEKYPEEIALGIYNMGYKAVDFWNDGKTITGYAEMVLARRREIFMEEAAE